MSGTGSIWLACAARDPAARVRLVCFPHLGGSAGFFRDWDKCLPEAEVYSVRYPGRGERFEEDPEEDLLALARKIAEALEPLAGKPVALFGHSMGAPVALETAGALERRGVKLAHVFASGSRDAPLPPRTEPVDEDPRELLEKLVRMGGTDADMAADPVFQEIVLPYLAADSKLFNSYQMAPDPLLSCPVSAIVGDVDPHADERPWSALTTGPFRQHVVSGDHFYLVETPPCTLLRESLGDLFLSNSDASAPVTP